MLVDAIPEEILEEIETDLNPFRETKAPTDHIDELENRMTSAVGLMEKVLVSAIHHFDR